MTQSQQNSPIAAIRRDLTEWIGDTLDLQRALRIHAHDHGTASDYKTILNLIADMDPMLRRAESLERAWKQMAGKNERCGVCDGKGVAMAFGIIYAKGHDGPFAKEMTCHSCDGKGYFTPQQVAWRRQGDEMRAYRLSFGMTLHRAALQLGRKPSEISAMESGKIDNSNWKNLPWEGQEAGQ